MAREELARHIQAMNRRAWEGFGTRDIWYTGAPEPTPTRIREGLHRSGFYKNLRPESTILEVGVGSHTYIEEPLVRGVHRIGFDLSSGMLEDLEEQYPGLYSRRIVGDARKLDDIPDNAVARVVFPLGPLRYLLREGQEDALMEAIRVTAPGGQVDIFDFSHVTYWGAGSDFSPAMIEDLLARDAIVNQLRAAGKRVEFSYTDEAVPAGRVSTKPEMFYHCTLRVQPGS